MPMMSRSREELDFVRERLRPELEAKLAAKGFVALLWGEGGWVQFFARARIVHPEDYKRARIFAWSGDLVNASVMKSRGYTPVPIPLADILPALETGMIDTVPVAPLWAMIGQFDRVARHLVRIDWVPIVGATGIRKQTLEAMRTEARASICAVDLEQTQMHPPLLIRPSSSRLAGRVYLKHERGNRLAFGRHDDFTCAPGVTMLATGGFQSPFDAAAKHAPQPKFEAKREHRWNR